MIYLRGNLACSCLTVFSSCQSEILNHSVTIKCIFLYYINMAKEEKRGKVCRCIQEHYRLLSSFQADLVNLQLQGSSYRSIFFRTPRLLWRGGQFPYHLEQRLPKIPFHQRRQACSVFIRTEPRILQSPFICRSGRKLVMAQLRAHG